MSLFGSHLDQSCSAQFQPDPLIANVSTHFDFDRVKKRAPTARQFSSAASVQFLPRLPVRDVKGPRSAGLRLPRQRYHRETPTAPKRNGALSHRGLAAWEETDAGS